MRDGDHEEADAARGLALADDGLAALTDQGLNDLIELRERIDGVIT